MQKFNYKAKSFEGQVTQGQIEARDTNSAVGVLRERGLVVVSIKSVNEKSGMFSFMFSKIKFDDIVTFTRQMATMIAAGLPLTETLSILEVQSRPAMSRVIGEILRDIQGGMSLGEAMAKHPKVFSRVYLSLVRAGEASGAIDKVLNRLADNLEKDKEFRSKTKGALIYPAIVTIGMLGVAVVMMVFVVPKLVEMYQDFDAELPLPTMILIGTSNLMIRFWYVMVGLVVAAVVGLKSFLKTETGRNQYDRLMLSAPIIGKLKMQIMLAEVSRTMGLLIGAGVSILESLEIVKGVLNNGIYIRALESCSLQVKKGVPFSVALTRQEVFPPILPNMVAVGEETGKMDEVLIKVSKYFEDEAENLIKGLTTALEPLIMIVLGVGVAFLVIAIIMPIYDLTNQF